MEFETLLVEEQEGILIVTLNRPRVLNALNTQMWNELCDVVEAFDKDKKLKVMVLTHVGKCFCAGSDLKERAEGKHDYPRGGDPTWGFGGMSRHYVKKPIIMAINGLCLGGGCEMLTAADLAVISDDGKIGLPEVVHGLLATGGGALLRIGRSIALKQAMELALTGDPVDAQTALQWGLVNRVVPEDEVLDTALELARRIAKNGPEAIRMTKFAILDCMDKSFMPVPDGWRMMEEYEDYCVASPEGLEGIAAFTEKREPDWSKLEAE